MSAKHIIAKSISGSRSGTVWMFAPSDYRVLLTTFKECYEQITLGKITDQGGTDSNGHKFKLLQGDDGKLYRVFADWSVLEHVCNETKQIEVCNRCGSANIMIDAWVHANDPEDVRTFDERFCESCDGSCKTRTVTVPIDFDIECDKYEEK